MFEGTERGLSNIIVVSILFDTCGSFLCICHCYKLSSVYSLQYFSLNCLLRSAWTSELGQQMCDCENSGQRILVLELGWRKKSRQLTRSRHLSCATCRSGTTGWLAKKLWRVCGSGNDTFKSMSLKGLV